MASRHLTSLNVAAASAVVLYYLGPGGGPGGVIRDEPERHRPELLLIGGYDHFELGSTIRSAAAFGWDRILLNDRFGVWFGANRATRSEGRAAARRSRNPIRVLPVSARGGAAATSRRLGPWGNLARGAAQAVIVPDESAGPFDPTAFSRVAKRVSVVQIDLPASDYVYHYRAVASIVLAEIARQVGQAPITIARRPGQRRPRYRAALSPVLEAAGEIIDVEALARD